MQPEISENTKAILLLTGQLVRGGGRAGAKPLTAAEYNRLAQWLRNAGKEPADLLSVERHQELHNPPVGIDPVRVGMLLKQWMAVGLAVEYWQKRSIWVMSRADPAYPASLKKRLREQAPALLYGCGSPSLLQGGGLVVEGSRNARERALACARQFGHLAGEAGQTVISGGARGIDRAAMSGALAGGGCAVGVLADHLENAVLNDRHREPLRDGHLTLMSPFDPSVRFHSWNAMARNKVIYALGDAGLVVDTAYGKGGTWSGAVEQLEKLRSVPIYVFVDGETREGIGALQSKGALPWPNPTSPEEMAEILANAQTPDREVPSSFKLEFEVSVKLGVDEVTSHEKSNVLVEDLDGEALTNIPGPKESLWIRVTELIEGECEEQAKSASEIREALGTEKRQTDLWLKKMVEESRLVKKARPVRYLTVRRDNRPIRPGGSEGRESPI